jgi:hypothetical protein
MNSFFLLYLIMKMGCGGINSTYTQNLLIDFLLPHNLSVVWLPSYFLLNNKIKANFICFISTVIMNFFSWERSSEWWDDIVPLKKMYGYSSWCKCILLLGTFFQKCGWDNLTLFLTFYPPLSRNMSPFNTSISHNYKVPHTLSSTTYCELVNSMHSVSFA